MASGREKCIFSAHDMDLPQDGWCLKDPTYANNCDPCFSAFKEETYCHKYHKYEDGWKQCDSCERQIHYDCIMALNTFYLNGAHGITCKECVKKENFMASNMSASSSNPSPVNCSLLNDSSSSSDNFTGEEFLTDPWTLTFPNNDPQGLGNAAIEGSFQPFQLPEPGPRFLFEKRLTATDCRISAGRLLLPKLYAETFLPMPLEQPKMPIVIKDTQGQTWNFNLRWSVHRKSRKYKIDGIRRCMRRMEWNAGDTMKFYRQANGELVMELVRADPGTSTS